jgi:hypothetical protein
VTGIKRRVVLDECLPRPIIRDLLMFDVKTAQRAGFAGLKNGALLAAISGNFDVFVTVDQNLRHRQNLLQLAFGIVVLSVPSNRLDAIQAKLPQLTLAIAAVAPGEVLLVV